MAKTVTLTCDTCRGAIGSMFVSAGINPRDIAVIRDGHHQPLTRPVEGEYCGLGCLVKAINAAWPDRVD